MGASILPMIFPILILAVVQTWNIGAAEAPIEAELQEFHFEDKSVTLQSRDDGNQTTVATADLSLQNRLQLLLSPKFVAGYPSDDWTPQQSRFVILAAVVPAFYCLAAFWLTAALLLKSANPVRALIAFGGGWLLGLLLVGSYVIIGARVGQSALVVSLIGLGVTSFFVSMFISAVYQTSTWNGFLVFVCHLFIAAILATISAVTVDSVIAGEKLDEILTQHVFEPVGLMAAPNNE